MELMFSVVVLVCVPMQLADSVRGAVLQQFSDCRILTALMTALRLYPDSRVTPRLTGLLLRMVVENNIFVDEFVSWCSSKTIDKESLSLANEPMLLVLLLNSTNEEVVADTLTIITQIARAAAHNYHHILGWHVLPPLLTMLHHPSAQLRSRACNALGNFFKFSGYFYKPFDSLGGVPLLMSGLTDTDPETRKYAAFAIGNLVFHSDYYYATAKSALVLLVALLADLAEKTRANATAAIANFARNSAVLDMDLVAAQAPHRLLALVADPVTALPLRRLALYSLGTLAKLRCCPFALFDRSLIILII